MRLENGRWSLLATHAGDEVVRAGPFLEVQLDLQAFWTEPSAS